MLLLFILQGTGDSDSHFTVHYEKSSGFLRLESLQRPGLLAHILPSGYLSASSNLTGRSTSFFPEIVECTFQIDLKKQECMRHAFFMFPVGRRKGKGTPPASASSLAASLSTRQSEASSEPQIEMNSGDLDAIQLKIEDIKVTQSTLRRGHTIERKGNRSALYLLF